MSSTEATDEFVKEIEQVLKNFENPLRLNKYLGESEGLILCLISELLAKEPELTSVSALRKVLTNAIEALSDESPRYHNLLTARYLQGYSVHIAAQRFHLSESSLYNYYRQASQRLAEILLEQEKRCKERNQYFNATEETVCSLCGRNSNEIKYLISIKPGAYICSECATDSIESFGQQGIYVRIARSIEFSPEYYQAGVSILNYFGTVLQEKYENLNARVRIVQDGLRVTLIIESPDGERERIEKALNEYGLVLQGRMTPEAFYSDNAVKVLELKQHLQIATLQIENQREILKLKEYQHYQQIQSLERQVQSLENQTAWLRFHVGGLLIYSGSSIEAFKNIVSEIIALAAQNSDSLKFSIELLIQKLEIGITEDDEEEVKSTLEEIKDKNPTLFKRISDLLIELVVKGGITGVSGNLLYEWLKQLF